MSHDLLGGLVVLEMAEELAGQICGNVLADLGAKVIRVVPPAGDGTGGRNVNNAGRAEALGRELGAGKTLEHVDLRTAEGQAHCRRLLEKADILIVSQLDQSRDAQGLAYGDLSAIHPRLIHARITGWGSTGPWAGSPATELTVQAAAGMMRYLGCPDGPPVRQGFDLVSVNTGLAAVQAVLAGILAREVSGQGQSVEVSMLATAIALMQWPIVAHSGPDSWEGRQLVAQDWSPDEGFECADGRCLIDLWGVEEAWPSLLRDIGRDDLASDPRFTSKVKVRLHVTELPALIAPQLRKLSFRELQHLVRDRYGGTIVPILSVAEAIEHPQVRALGVIDENDRRIRFPVLVR